MHAVSAPELRLLQALGTYRLLNVEQMRQAGLSARATALRGDVRSLKRKGLLNHSEPHLISGMTTLPRLHWLTDRGAELLQDAAGNGPMGARRVLGEARQVLHRIAIVDVHIALRRWAAAAGREVGWFMTDFEPGYGGFEKPTTIPYPGGRYTPDAVGDVIGPDGASRLLVLEVERGRATRRPSDFRKKLPELVTVCEGQVVPTYFGARYSARFLIVFADAKLRDKVLAEWPEPDADRWRHFFIKSVAEVGDFNAGWWHPNGRHRRPLFSWATAPQGQTIMPLPAA